MLLNKISCILLLIALSSCNSGVMLSDERIKLSCDVINSFELNKLEVTELTEEEIPKEYKTIETVRCVPNHFVSSNELEEKLLKNELLAFNKANKFIDSLTLVKNGIKISELSKEDFFIYQENKKIIKEIKEKYFSFKKKKVVLFVKENKNYKWIINSGGETEVVKSVPLFFEKETWYIFKGLPSCKVISIGSSYNLFVYIDSNGELFEYYGGEF